jgi:hypothetical protein
MSIHLDCPVCNQRLNISNAGVGRMIQCVACGNAIRVPDPKSLMATKTAKAPLTERLRLQLEQIGPRSSDFVARRPLAALGILVVFVAALIGLRFAKGAISDLVANSRAQAAPVTGPIDPEPWEGVGLVDQNDHVRVTAKEVTVDQVTVVRPSVGVKRKSLKRYLKIVLEIQNLDSNEKIHYSGWEPDANNQDQVATMKDDTGGQYRQPRGADVIVGQFNKDSIEPNSSIEDFLVFDFPLPYVKYLKLALPAKAVGGTGTLRIKIPRKAEKMRD